MADHEVTLNYENQILKPLPTSISVKQGQTISFVPGEGVASNGFRVTFDDPHFFSAPQFTHGDGDVTVATLPQYSTGFRCELVSSDGTAAPSAGNNQGGKIEPAMD